MEYTSQIEKLQRRWQDNLHGTTFAPLAEAYRKAGMFEDALGALEIGLSRHPKYFPGHIVLGRCYLDLKDEVKAEEAFLKVIELDSENVIALMALANLAERHGRREVAIDRLERLLDLDPANEDALAQLARVTAVPATVVVPVLEETEEEVEEEEPDSPTDEVPIGQGGVTDPARADVDVQPFQPVELIPIESTRPEVPNEPEPLPIPEREPVSQVEPAVPEPVELSAAPPAEAPDEPIAILEEIPWEPEPVDLEPVPEPAATAPVLPAGNAFDPAWDDHPPDLAAEAAARPEEPPAVETPPVAVSAGPGDAPTRHFTLEPTRSQLPVIPPLPPDPPPRPAPPVAEALPARAEEPGAPAMAEPASAFSDREVVAEAESWAPLAEEPVENEVPATDAPEPEPVAELDSLTNVAEEPAPIAGESTEPEPAAAPEHLTATAGEPAPSVEVPTMAAILAGSSEPVPAPEEDAPSATESELVVTETMAEIFLRQGYAELALAVYSQLAARDPGNLRIEAAKARLLTELAPPAPAPRPEAPVRHLAAATTGGRPATTWLAQVLSVRPPGAAPPVHPPAFEPLPGAEPTRASHDTLSLSSVFGDEAPPAPADASQIAEEVGPSFDEFFRTPAEPAPIAGEAPSGSGQPIEDLEQFNAWLKGLKR